MGIRSIYFSALLIFCLLSCHTKNQFTYMVDQWDKITLSFKGPSSEEQSDNNPFLNYRLNVTFVHDSATISLPGFYAADGHSAETSADTGSVWQVRFRPPFAGLWKYSVSFLQGDQIAVSDDFDAGISVAFDGQNGIIHVSPKPKHPGRLITSDKHYLQYASSKAYFLKGGADSPENFLAYFEFDGTYKGENPEAREGEATGPDGLHHYAPHGQDWRNGDPFWQNGKGKNIIGALNYLASKGMNSVYFLTMNIKGDGKDVWPYTSYEERLRFDCSKLDQWEIVFDHMDRLGIMLHVVTQETENETLLDDGNTGIERKLYYRELIARFGHHLKVTWNIGEENGPAHFSPIGQTIDQQKAAVKYLKTHDPYKNMVVIHTHSWADARDPIFEKLLGYPYLDGMSLQIARPIQTYEVTKKWRILSEEAGVPWTISMDEIGPHWRGLDPDDRVDSNQDTIRHVALWGSLMAGGAGAEWYFGYKNHSNDLNCEDWRSRDRFWDQTRYALDFFHDHLPFYAMEAHNDLLTYDGRQEAFCFAKPGEVYAIYFPDGGNSTLDLSDTPGDFLVTWYNPRKGGPLSNSFKVSGTKAINLKTPEDQKENDWVALVRKE